MSIQILAQFHWLIAMPMSRFDKLKLVETNHWSDMSQKHFATDSWSDTVCIPHLIFLHYLTHSQGKQPLWLSEANVFAQDEAKVGFSPSRDHNVAIHPLDLETSRSYYQWGVGRTHRVDTLTSSRMRLRGQPSWAVLCKLSKVGHTWFLFH